MPAISDMSAADKALHGHSESKALYTKANRWRRELTLQQAYILRDALDAAKIPQEEQAIYEEYALESGQSVDALKEEARWTKYIKLADIRLAFAEELITDPEWQMRIGTSHVKQAAIAREQDTRRALTSEEKAQLLLECFHANWTVAEFKAELRRRGLKKPALLPPPTKLPTTATAMLERILAALVEQSIDVGLVVSPEAADKPVKIGRALRKLADLLDEHYPGAEFRLRVEVKPDGP